jgi:SAM-dependent methyltransferase
MKIDSEGHHVRSSCRVCGGDDLYKFLDLGATPLADAFLTEAQLHDGSERYFPLAIYVCRSCNHMQLLNVVDPRLLFPEQYAFFSSGAPSMVEHFREYAEDIREKFGKNGNKLIIEIASNDGVLLAPLKEFGFEVLGIEPTTNTAAVARLKGIEVIEDFFSEALSESVVSRHGRAGVVLANNVLAHVDDPADFIRGVKKILDERGVFIFEVQYGFELIRHTEFDNIYHEHLSFFTVRALDVLVKKCGMKIFDIKQVDAQGGSLRCYATHTENGACPTTGIPSQLREMEIKEGLSDMRTYDHFGKRVVEVKTELLKIIKDAKSGGKKIVGYGAPAKGNTLLNFSGIGPDLVDYCIEKTPSKFGKFTPGMHIPIVSDEVVKKEGPPDFYLLLVWNYLNKILKREKEYLTRGGKFIVPIPNPRIISNGTNE